jgi:hypothetical protein
MIEPGSLEHRKLDDERWGMRHEIVEMAKRGEDTSELAAKLKEAEAVLGRSNSAMPRKVRLMPRYKVFFSRTETLEVVIDAPSANDACDAARETAEAGLRLPGFVDAGVDFEYLDISDQEPTHRINDQGFIEVLDD